MAYKIEYFKKNVLTELVIDADMARNEGTKSVFYKDGSVTRMINTEDIQDLYTISDEEAGIVRPEPEPEPEPEAPVEEVPPTEDEETEVEDPQTENPVDEEV